MGNRGRVYNRIYTDADWDKVNLDNKAFMEDYLQEYRQRKMKPSTLTQYHNDLRIILIYILKNCGNQSILKLTKKHFRNFSIWCSEEKHMSNARTNRLMSVVRSCLTYGEDDDETEYENNVAKKVKGLPKDPVKTDEDAFYLTFDQIMKLRNELIKREELQDASMLMTFFDTGARKNEVFQLNKQWVKEGSKTNMVTGKRGKKFTLRVMSDTRELILQYLDQRGEDNIDSLWVIGKGENKRPILYSTIYDRILAMYKILEELEGKPIKAFVHSLRHSRAESLTQGTDTRIIDEITGLPKKFPIEHVKSLLHHESSATTELYVKDHSDDIIDTMYV